LNLAQQLTNSSIRSRLLIRVLRSHEIKGSRYVGFQIAPWHDRVEHAVLQQEFAPLETLRKFLADGLLDDTGSGES